MGKIFEYKLRQYGIDAIHASILSSDLTSFSGDKVVSIADLVEAGVDTSTPVIHVGGETLPVTMATALTSDSPISVAKRYRGIVSRHVEEMLSLSREYGYVTPPQECVNGRCVTWPNRIFYGVGFTKADLNEKDTLSLREALADARMVGVRDQQSLLNMKKLGIDKVELTPDIVLAISEILPRPSIKKKSHTLLMHFNQNYLARNANQLIAELTQIATSFQGDFSIGLAGVANGHDSLDELYRFSEQAADSAVNITVLPSLDVFEICRQISAASIVVSTSLHYRIVARSYGIPRISMDNHKLNCWAESNDSSHPYGVTPNALSASVRLLASGLNRYESGCEYDGKMIDSVVERIATIIQAVQPSLDKKHDPLSLKKAVQAPSCCLWLAGLSRCLEEKDATIKRQQSLLSSRRELLRHLIKKFVEPG